MKSRSGLLLLFVGFPAFLLSAVALISTTITSNKSRQAIAYACGYLEGQRATMLASPVTRGVAKPREPFCEYLRAGAIARGFTTAQD